MNQFFKNSIVVLFAVAVVLGLSGPMTAHAFPNPVPVPLLSADSFAILAGTPNITNVGGSIIYGNVGLSPATGAGIGLTCLQVNGTIYSVDAAGLPCFAGNPPLSNKTLVDNAKIALTAAYINAAGRLVDATIPTELGGQTLTQGVYDSGSTTFQITAGAGPLILDGLGDPNAVFIFKMGFAGVGLTVGPGSIVNLINGAQARNVFWQVDTATINTTATFKGNILALNSITAANASVIEGRLLARNGNVTLINNTVSVPTNLTLIKVVNGGSSLATAWTLSATGPTLISGATGSVAVTSAGVVPGLYTLAESVLPAGYTASTYSCVINGGVPVLGNTVTLVAGDNAVCTITNDVVGGGGGGINNTITVFKQVINDNGGIATYSDFPLFINSTAVTSGQNVSLTPGIYTVSETSKTGYTTTFAGDCNAIGVINHGGLGTQNDICTVINNDIGAPAAIIPPLIHITKIPTPLSFPAGPGTVTYNYDVSNVGIVPMTNVTVTDNKCSLVNYLSGDTNLDSKLDVTETWKYSCSMMISQNTLNTVTATGRANGLTATDQANAAVVVGSPLVPPLIDLIKVPTPLFLPVGGGSVKYTYLASNPGTVALNNVSLVDNKCSAISSPTGDTNGNSQLDTNEIWTYTCTMNLTATTTNTATVTGSANGFTVTHASTATVAVAAPVLPNTGSSPENRSILGDIVTLAGIFAVSIFFYFAFRKQTS